mgnify:CR=1 FL=1
MAYICNEIAPDFLGMSFGGQVVEGAGPAGVRVADGRAERIAGKDLMPGTAVK